MYLQFPGGSNNRLNEANRQRKNGNRLFDSQNNNRFGYNQHSHYFYTNSIIDLQWTIQHSCGPDSNLNCDIILQYACGDDFRDGDTTETIPLDQNSCKKSNCSTDFYYGMHENFRSYQECSLRERNKGLFTADRNLKGDDARYTKLQNGGTRYGYECNEEKDYYPYWYPTIWRDIAIFTDDLDRCDFYQKNSENVKGRWYCEVSDEFIDRNFDEKSADIEDRTFIPLDQKSCEKLVLPNGQKAVWKQSERHKYPNGNNLPKPECLKAPYQRDNHHGNGEGRYFIGHKWQVPDNLIHDKCTIRVRYNITSTDYDAWNVNGQSKSIDDRLSIKPDILVGTEAGILEDFSKTENLDGKNALISGYWVQDIENDLSNSLEVNPRPWDNRIVFKRDDVLNNWTVSTENYDSAQWFGWQDDKFGGKTVQLTFSVKFKTKPDDLRKITEKTYGAKFYGDLYSSWVEEAPIGKWHKVSITHIMDSWGDSNRIMLIFDNIEVEFEIKDFQLKVVDEFENKNNPFRSMQDDFGFDSFTAKSRGYQHRNDANLQIFQNIPMRLRSAYNTDQLGRVFEDRSYIIQFKELKGSVRTDVRKNGKKLYNLNVRGKLGNNVQVYPAFEYDFAPSRLVANQSDYIHIQWSGSNTNNRENDGSQKDDSGNNVELLKGRDRFNMVYLDHFGDLKPSENLEKLGDLFGLGKEASLELAFSGVKNADNEFMQSAGSYFDLGIRQLEKEGKFMFMSSVNNKFGVRSHKGKIVVV